MSSLTTREKALEKLLTTNHPYPNGLDLRDLSKFFRISRQDKWWEDAKKAILKRFPKAQLPHRINQVWGYGLVSKNARSGGASGIWWNLDNWDTVTYLDSRKNKCADITEPMVKHTPRNFIDR